MERLLKINEVSDLLQVSRKTIYNWVCYGHIPHIKVYGSRNNGGGLLRFRQSDLDNWLDKRKQNVRSTYKEMTLPEANVKN